MTFIMEVPNRGVYIDDLFIPAVNVQMEDFPKMIDGVCYYPCFEIIFEHLSGEAMTWFVIEINGSVILFDEYTPDGIPPADTIERHFDSWPEFVDFYKKYLANVDSSRGFWMDSARFGSEEALSMYVNTVD